MSVFFFFFFFFFFQVSFFGIFSLMHPQEKVWLGGPNVLGIKFILDVGYFILKNKFYLTQLFCRKWIYIYIYIYNIQEVWPCGTQPLSITELQSVCMQGFI